MGGGHGDGGRGAGKRGSGTGLNGWGWVSDGAERLLSLVYTEGEQYNKWKKLLPSSSVFIQ